MGSGRRSAPGARPSALLHFFTSSLLLKTSSYPHIMIEIILSLAVILSLIVSLVVRLSPRKLVTVPPYGRKSVEAILLVDAATDDHDNVGVEAGESVEREASSVKVEVTNELGPGVRERDDITNLHSSGVQPGKGG